MDEFGSVLRDFVVNLVPEQAHAVQETTALRGLQSLIAMTPVDQGIARGGWQVTIGEAGALSARVPDSNKKKAPMSDADALSSSAYKDGERIVVSAPPFSLITIYNNVEYIDILEDGRLEGSAAGEGEFPFGAGITGKARRTGARGSMQAPHGMLGVTFVRLANDLTTEVDAA